MKHTHKWVIGVDEAGRGPLAGPVSVGVVLVPHDFDWEQVPGVNDSKKLTEKKREEIFKLVKLLVKEGQLRYAVAMQSARVIDNKGIVPTIKTAMVKGLQKVTKNETGKAGKISAEIFPADVQILLDGSLHAPKEYIHQETIIKGDSKEKVIGLASIMAKVTRDQYMVQKSQEAIFAPYTFAQHKGYGTKAHRAAIAIHGLSSEHRVSYCKNIK